MGKKKKLKPVLDSVPAFVKLIPEKKLENNLKEIEKEVKVQDKNVSLESL